MNELTEVKNRELEKYEKLLLKKDSLKREALKYRMEYIRVFSDVNLKLYRLRVECIRKKKMISYCQKCLNRGEDISENALNAYISTVMRKYDEELERIIKEHAEIQNAPEVSAYDISRIKAAYKRIAKKIHPDLHPELEGDETLAGLWSDVYAAYVSNNLERITELEFLIDRHLDNTGAASGAAEVPGLEKKIEKLERDIEEIVSTDPYMYRFLLSDPELVKNRREEIKEEIDGYRQYLSKLEEMLASFEIRRFMS